MFGRRFQGPETPDCHPSPHVAERVVTYHHCHRPAGWASPAGAILTETVFSWPGIGRWLVDAIHARDYPIVQGVTLFIAIIFVTVNLLIDVLYAVVDPRIRLS